MNASSCLVGICKGYTLNYELFKKIILIILKSFFFNYGLKKYTYMKLIAFTIAKCTVL